MTFPDARSLRFRLGALGAAAILIALALAQLGMVWLFERHVERRFAEELHADLDQLAAAAEFGADEALTVDARLADPRFEKVYGGLYWQALDEATGALKRSRSLWDQALSPPEDTPPIGVIHAHDVDGPNGARLMLRERRLILRSSEGERVVRFIVAIDRREIDALTRAFAAETMLGLAMLAALLIAASLLQLGLGLKPLAQLRRRLAAMRGGGARRLETDAPSEIEPLVAEVNALLETQERSIEKARRRAADLAHGFNTPLTSLLSDVRRLREKGETAIAAEIEQTVRAMRRQIERELSRARVVDARAPKASCAVAPLADGLLRTLARTPDGERVAFTVDLGPDPDALRAGAAEEDLAEALGNLLENAARHAAGAARLSVRREGDRLAFLVEDDGPGVAENQRAAILDRGLRLDRAGSGAGLGLAIVSDVLERYGAALTLGASSLGGLAAGFDLPAASPTADPQAAAQG